MSDILNEIRPICPVDVGDTFYRSNACVAKGAAMPDRIQVVSIEPLDPPIVMNEETGLKSYYRIHGKYLYHAIGPDLERDFSDAIFQNPEWVVEHKNRGAVGNRKRRR